MISVITPTYQNHADLLRATASLDAQTYTGWQHVVVADGPDPELRQEMDSRGYRSHGKRIFTELGRNWHGFLGGDNGAQVPGSPGSRGGRGSRGAEAALIGTHLAAGDRIAYLDADCQYEPHHLEVVNKALDAAAADFAYGQMARHLDGQLWNIVGDGFVAYGRIDGNMIVHKAELLQTANWRWAGDADWDLIGRWHATGARAEFVPQVTIRWHHASADLR